MPAVYESAAVCPDSDFDATRDTVVPGPIAVDDIIIHSFLWQDEVTDIPLTSNLGLTWNTAAFASADDGAGNSFDGYTHWARVASGQSSGGDLTVTLTANGGFVGQTGAVRVSSGATSGDPWESGCTAMTASTGTPGSGNTGTTAQSDGLAIAFVFGNAVTSPPTAQSGYTQRAVKSASAFNIACSVQTRTINASTASAQYGNPSGSDFYYAVAMILAAGGGGGATFRPPTRVHRPSGLIVPASTIYAR